jgi:hypothetical protein
MCWRQASNWSGKTARESIVFTARQNSGDVVADREQLQRELAGGAYHVIMTI